MKTIPPEHAEHQLTQVANRFEEWRQTRTTRTPCASIWISSYFMHNHTLFRLMLITRSQPPGVHAGGPKVVSQCPRYYGHNPAVHRSRPSC